MKTVAIIGTFDTKGEEFAYVKTRFEELGINTITIHCGVILIRKPCLTLPTRK